MKRILAVVVPLALIWGGLSLLRAQNADPKPGATKEQPRDGQPQPPPPRDGQGGGFPGFGGPGGGGPGGGGFGGPGGPMGQERKLVGEFDKDNDGRLNREERQAARTKIKEDRANGRD